jgi:hypothetical protein
MTNKQPVTTISFSPGARQGIEILIVDPRITAVPADLRKRNSTRQRDRHSKPTSFW